MTINIAGLEKGAVLAALWNNATLGPDPDTQAMTAVEGREILVYRAGRSAVDDYPLKDAYGFDYYKGRILKIDLYPNTIDPWGYDRDNGAGLAERVISNLRATGSVDKLADA